MVLKHSIKSILIRQWKTEKYSASTVKSQNELKWIMGNKIPKIKLN